MDPDFYSPETKLVDQIISNLSNNLQELIDRRTKRWQHPFMHCEGFTIGIFNDLNQNISKERAFLLIPIALNIVLEQTGQDLFVTSLSLLEGLARASQTTEAPLMLIENKDILNEKVNSHLKNKESQMYQNSIKKCYRLN